MLYVRLIISSSISDNNDLQERVNNFTTKKALCSKLWLIGRQTPKNLTKQVWLRIKDYVQNIRLKAVQILIFESEGTAKC